MERPAAPYLAVALHPIVFLNSSWWGQCDAIYAFFCVLALVCFFHRRYVLCFIAYGAAFAFKLQSVFLLPFFLYACVEKKRYSFLHFLLVPLTMIALSLPALLRGAGLTDVFAIYLEQAAEYKTISLAYPSFWNIFIEIDSSQRYDMLRDTAIATTVGVLGVLMALRLSQKRSGSRRDLKNAFLFAYACVLFLPGMHERYDYLPVILALAYALISPRTAPLFLLLSYISARDYANYLFDLAQNDELLVILNLVCFAGYCYAVLWPGRLPRLILPEKQKSQAGSPDADSRK